MFLYLFIEWGYFDRSPPARAKWYTGPSLAPQAAVSSSLHCSGRARRKKRSACLFLMTVGGCYRKFVHVSMYIHCRPTVDVLLRSGGTPTSFLTFPFMCHSIFGLLTVVNLKSQFEASAALRVRQHFGEQATRCHSNLQLSVNVWPVTSSARARKLSCRSFDKKHFYLIGLGAVFALMFRFIKFVIISLFRPKVSSAGNESVQRWGNGWNSRYIPLRLTDLVWKQSGLVLIIVCFF